MLFFVKQVHSPDHCPVASDKGADALFDPNAEGVIIHFGVSDAPRHTFYFLLEADDLDPIRDFLDNGLTDCVAEINPVARLGALNR